MPFTFSHPAIVVPLKRFGLVFSALIIGSIIPDFGYFFPVLPAASISHRLPGFFYFCLPVACVVFVLFQVFMKEPLILLTPDSHRRRLVSLVNPGFALFPLSWRAVLLVIFSILVGILSHVLWDSVTHSYGWLVKLNVEFRETVIKTPLGVLPLYKIFQHGSTLLGGGFLIWWYTRWFRKTLPDLSSDLPRLPVWLRSVILTSIIALSTAGGLHEGLAGGRSLSTIRSWSIFLNRGILFGMAVFLLTLFIYSVLCSVWLVTSRKTGPERQ